MDMSSCRSLQQGISWLYSFKLEILMRLLDWICSIMNICFVLFADARCWKISNIFAVSEFIQSWVCLEQNVWSINKEKRPGNADRWCLFPISQWYCPNGGGSVWEIKRCNNRLSSPLDLALMVLRVARFDLHFPLVNSLFELTCLWCLFTSMIWVMGW